jgi:hypothetical protein
MKITTKLLILELLGGMFGLICASAAIASVYFMYGAFAKVARWSYVIWAFGAGFIAMLIADALIGGRQRVDFVDQFIGRGYSKGDAVEAWRTANSGGLNLLRNLQQAELSKQTNRLETAIDTPNTDGDST